jgi:hypothetical protein
MCGAACAAVHASAAITRSSTRYTTYMEANPVSSRMELGIVPFNPLKARALQEGESEGTGRSEEKGWVRRSMSGQGHHVHIHARTLSAADHHLMHARVVLHVMCCCVGVACGMRGRGNSMRASADGSLYALPVMHRAKKNAACVYVHGSNVATLALHTYVHSSRVTLAPAARARIIPQRTTIFPLMVLSSACSVVKLLPERALGWLH